MYIVVYFCSAPKVGSTNDLVEHDGVEFHASTDSGLHSETDSPMLSKQLFDLYVGNFLTCIKLFYMYNISFVMKYVQL